MVGQLSAIFLHTINTFKGNSNYMLTLLLLYCSFIVNNDIQLISDVDGTTSIKLNDEEQSQHAVTLTSNTSVEVSCGYMNFHPRPEIVELQTNNYTQVLSVSDVSEDPLLFDGHSDKQIIELQSCVNTIGCNVDGILRSIVVYRTGKISWKIASSYIPL